MRPVKGSFAIAVNRWLLADLCLPKLDAAEAPMAAPLAQAMGAWKSVSPLPPSLVGFNFASSGPGRIPWCEADVVNMAAELKRTLPFGVVQVLSSPDWQGGPLIQLADDTSRPTAEEVVMNHVWIKPFVQRFRACVPSGYFCTDVMLCLDKLFNDRLLLPTTPQQTKKSLAATEGSRVKRLIGALRFLWRSSISADFSKSVRDGPH